METTSQLDGLCVEVSEASVSRLLGPGAAESYGCQLKWMAEAHFPLWSQTPMA